MISSVFDDLNYIRSMNEGQGKQSSGAPADPIFQLQAQMQVQQEMLLFQEQQMSMSMMLAQLVEATNRMASAEEERNLALKLASGEAKSLVDNRKFSGKSDEEFAECEQKFQTFVKAKFCENVERMLAWA